MRPTALSRRDGGFIALIALITLSGGCRIADIRPGPLHNTTQLARSDVERGRELLAQMAQAHGGVASLRAHGTATLTITDTWYGALNRAAVMPWPQNAQRFEHQFLLTQDTSRVTLLEGRRAGEVWGVQQWCTYRQRVKDEEIRWRRDEDIWFWLPTVQYFFEAPLRLHEGQHVAYGGSMEHEGRRYERVYITWGSVTPSMEADQYVAWIDAETKRLFLLEYTVRDFFRFVKGLARYEDYREVGGLQWPHRIAIFDGGWQRPAPLHTLELESVRVGEPTPDALVPRPECRARKEDRGG